MSEVIFKVVPIFFIGVVMAAIALGLYIIPRSMERNNLLQDRCTEAGGRYLQEGRSVYGICWAEDGRRIWVE